MNRINLNGMKNYCILLGLLCLLTACNLTEKLNVEINEKPTLRVTYPSNNRIGTLHIMIYGPDGKFVDSLVVNDNQTKASTEEITLLAGIAEGNYQVVCFGNLEKSKISELSKGVSVLNDLSIEVSSGAVYTEGTDRIYHSIGTFAVRRGQSAGVPIELVPRYYAVELTLQSEEDNPNPVGIYSASLVNIPAGFDCHGVPQTLNYCSVTPELTTDEAAYRRAGAFPMNRFSDNDGVELILYKEGKSFARVPILPSECGVDPTSPEEVILPVVVEIAVNKLIININDWNTVITDIENTGD